MVVMAGAAATGALFFAAAFELATTAPTPAAPMPSTTAPVATHVTILRFIVPLPVSGDPSLPARLRRPA